MQGLCRGLLRGLSQHWEPGKRSLSLTPSMGTVIVERWWQIPLAPEGKEPYLHPRRHRIYRLVEDTQHRPKENMELILTQNVKRLGNRGETVSVSKQIGRNKLLAKGLAVYPTPENKEAFEEENRLRLEGKSEERVQTWTGEMTVDYLKSARFEIALKTDVKWELTTEVVCRKLLRTLGVVVPTYALKLSEEPITSFGEYWCEVTVNGIDTVRMPMHVVSVGNPRQIAREGQGTTEPSAES